VLVIADTSPLNYLILIDGADLLPRLYGRVILPVAACEELQHPDAPVAVGQWARQLPSWIELREAPASADPRLAALGKGERAAIVLAELYAPEPGVLLLVDEEAARKEAALRHIAATGTLGVLKSAAAQGWINLGEAFDSLRRTNFRVSAALLQQLLDDDARR
jgi:predicted nucleic acid-binding protein